MGWFVLSILLMAYVGGHRYSVSNRLMRIFVEVPAEKVKVFEGMCILLEMFLIFSDETVWRYNYLLLLIGFVLLFLGQFVLLRIAGKVTSSINLLINRRRLASIKKWARRRRAYEFM